MSIALLILQVVVVIGALIFFHELGHFLAARAVGVPVEEFGFGYPPRLAKIAEWKGTEITLNWIPFGGFVRPKGETDENVEGGMAAAPAWKRLVIALSGPVMNFLNIFRLWCHGFTPSPPASIMAMVNRIMCQVGGLMVLPSLYPPRISGCLHQVASVLCRSAPCADTHRHMHRSHQRILLPRISHQWQGISAGRHR